VREAFKVLGGNILTCYIISLRGIDALGRVRESAGDSVFGMILAFYVLARSLKEPCQHPHSILSS